MPEFEKTLKDMVQQYPETRLIIIDVLARVEQPSRGKGSYLEDYAAMSPFQRFALDHGIGIVGVTHTNQKEVMTDKFHKITGTTGKIGCADTLLLLQKDREEASAVLSVTGRDVVEGVFKIAFHSGVWVVQGERATPKPGPEPVAREAAKEFLRAMLVNGRCWSEDIFREAKVQGISPSTLRKAQGDLGIESKKNAGDVKWYWSFPTIHNGGRGD